MAARGVATLCATAADDVKRLTELLATFDGPALAGPANAALAERLAQNTADQAIGTPLLLLQGLADEIVPPDATEAYVRGRCAVGQRLEYWTFTGLDHSTIVQPGTRLAEPLLAWTRARFGNERQAIGCSQKSF